MLVLCQGTVGRDRSEVLDHGAAVLVGDQRQEVDPGHLLAGGAEVSAVGLVDKRERAVGNEAADEFGLVFDDRAVAGLALAQDLFGLPALGDVADDLDRADDLSAVPKNRVPVDVPRPAVGRGDFAFRGRAGIHRLLHRTPVARLLASVPDLVAHAADELLRRQAGRLAGRAVGPGDAHVTVVIDHLFGQTAEDKGFSLGGFPQRLLGVSAVGDVLGVLDGADDVSLGVPQGEARQFKPPGHAAGHGDGHDLAEDVAGLHRLDGRTPGADLFPLLERPVTFLADQGHLVGEHLLNPAVDLQEREVTVADGDAVLNAVEDRLEELPALAKRLLGLRSAGLALSQVGNLQAEVRQFLGQLGLRFPLVIHGILPGRAAPSAKRARTRFGNETPAPPRIPGLDGCGERLSRSEKGFPNSRSAGVYPRRGSAVGLTIRAPGIKPGATDLGARQLSRRIRIDFIAPA